MTGAPVTVGRASACTVCIGDDTLVSRMHARFSLHGERLHLEDLNSTNGVLVDDHPLRGAIELRGGETVQIGNSQFRVVRSASEAAQTWTGDTATRELPVLADESPGPDGTARADLFEVLAGLAEKALTMGDAEAVRRVFGAHLERLKRQAERGDVVQREQRDRAAMIALRLATLERSSAGFDYCVGLYAASGELMPMAVVERLFEVVREVSGAKPGLLREYLAKLDSGGDSRPPSEGFIVRRLRSLEQQLAG